MGYYPIEKKGVITPPKNGTNTVSTVATAIYLSKEHRPGPLKYSEVTDYLTRTGEVLSDYEFAMVIRDPIDRLVSMINYRNNFNAGGSESPSDFETAMSRSYNEPEAYLYKPQTYYWHPKYDPPIRIFTSVQGIVEWMGWPSDKPVPRENVGPKLWSKERIMDHKHFNALIALYDADLELPFNCNKSKVKQRA